ncbi:MAG: molybdopterin molybdotransferase MoeA [Actinobacteria bacterium]|nr:molybdopterin molybdotransferase MoeA [Actinomycetota bacterium]
MASELTEIEDARRLVLDRAERLAPEQVPVAETLGRVLAADARGAEPVPASDNSAMDGYAIRSADTAGAESGNPASLRLAGESRAGHPSARALGAGEAIAISTGAVIPDGADAVIRVEDTDRDGDSVRVRVAVEPGRDIRRAGEDIEPGQLVIEAGTEVGPAELGVLASLGAPSFSCARRPRLAVLGTGDELLSPGEPARPGGVRNTNGLAVTALASRAGAQALGAETVGDDPDATLAAVGRALEADVAVICGGVSVGEHDHVRGALDELGTLQVFWGIALRPGKPTWFGVGPAGGLVFGLPGNPVSAIVTFILFVRPAIRAMQGADPAAAIVSATLDEDYPKQPGRAHAVRVRLRQEPDGLRASSTGAQGSHVLTSMLGADGLAIIPAESGGVAAGESVRVELLDR